MSITTLIIIILAIGVIAGGILTLKKSANKFNLTDEQLAGIKKRNQELDKAEEAEK